MSQFWPESIGVRIAVVDDSEAVRRSLLLLLGTRGFQVSTYPGGRDLLGGGDLRRFACFVIDFKLGDLGGIDLLTEIRRRGFDQPAILISGWEQEGLDRLAMAAGFTSFVRKPMTQTSITSEIERMLLI